MFALQNQLQKQQSEENPERAEEQDERQILLQQIKTKKTILKNRFILIAILHVLAVFSLIISLSLRQWFKIEEKYQETENENNNNQINNNNNDNNQNEQQQQDFNNYIWISLIYLYDPKKLGYESFRSYFSKTQHTICSIISEQQQNSEKTSNCMNFLKVLQVVGIITFILIILSIILQFVDLIRLKQYSVNLDSNDHIINQQENFLENQKNNNNNDNFSQKNSILLSHSSNFENNNKYRKNVFNSKFYQTCKGKILHPLISLFSIISILLYPIMLQLNNFQEYKGTFGMAYWMGVCSIIVSILLYFIYRKTKNDLIEFEAFYQLFNEFIIQKQKKININSVSIANSKTLIQKNNSNLIISSINHSQESQNIKYKENNNNKVKQQQKNQVEIQFSQQLNSTDTTENQKQIQNQQLKNLNNC